MSHIQPPLICRRFWTRPVVHIPLLGENVGTVVDNELHGEILGVHIGHFSLNGGGPHDGWRKDDGQVLGCHLRTEYGLACFILKSVVVIGLCLPDFPSRGTPPERDET